jgi:Family of unknown function (DUF6866) C-terminal domain/Family of unknown function (DUF6866) N-terminal domain
MPDLKATVQQNCHISDSLFAGNYTLCIYLLKMREFYRWETQQAFGTEISKDDIGTWLTRREQEWDDLEDLDYSPLKINNTEVDPFETQLINDLLNKQNLVYSGGYGMLGKPVFFLAELERKQIFDDYTLYISSKELARDLAAPPGMMQEKNIFIRRESLKRFIWEKIEESEWYNNENPLARTLAFYDFKKHPEESLEKMTDAEIETVIHHEIGEIKAGQLLGNEWEGMIASLPRSQAELMSRAVRDNLADALSTLPMLMKDAEPASIHFYFANMSSMRKLIFPGIMNSYQQWVKSGDKNLITKLISKSEQHWLNIARSLINLHQKHGEECYPHMEALINSNHL